MALCAVIGKTKMKKSLRTKDPEEAKHLAKVYGIEVDAIFAKARQGAVTLTTQDANFMVYQRFCRELDDDSIVEPWVNL